MTVLDSFVEWTSTWDTLRFWVEIITLVMTGVCMYLMGNKTIWGPIFGIIAQIPWAVFIVLSGAWGLAGITVMMLVIHTRNLVKWYRES